MAATAAKLIILGGSGFVGAAVAEEALRRGMNVVCLSRSGSTEAPHAWADKATWAKADALKPDTYREHLRGAAAVVVSIGSPPLPFVDRDYQARCCARSHSGRVESRSLFTLVA